MLATPEAGTVRSYNTHENNAPYFMFANRDGFTELYAQNHPAYGFYQDNGHGGNTYDEGFPKGLYKLSVRYWNQKGQGSNYPSTRRPVGDVLLYKEYWFRIQSRLGVGMGPARQSVEQSATDEELAFVSPNPVSKSLVLTVRGMKKQAIDWQLMDLTGRELKRQSFLAESDSHREEIEMIGLATGVYLMQITAIHKKVTLKVIKVH